MVINNRQLAIRNGEKVELVELQIPWEIIPLFFLMAFLFSSVGHGGASGYLALFALAGVARSEIAPVVLVLNILVAGSSFINYYRAKHFSFQLLLPFIISSIPAAFVGGLLKVPSLAFSIILGSVLLLAAVRLLFVKNGIGTRWQEYSGKAFYWGIPIGFIIGILSGITGVGGGIFLSPFLLLTGWADAKKTSAVSAAFIILNSLSALLAKSLTAPIHFDIVLIFGIVVLMAGQIGSRLGAFKFQPDILQKLLGAVLLIAGLKLIKDLLL